MSVIFSSIIDENLSLSNLLIVVLSAVILGVIVGACYMLTHRKTGWSQSLIGTFAMLPAVIAIIIMLVGSNVAKAFSLAGAFSLIRFRSAPGDVKDLTYLFFSLAIGLSCGEGFIGYAVVFTVILCLLMVVLELTSFGAPKQTDMVLRITIPENLNFEGAFDDILKANSTSFRLKKVRTTDFGSLFEVVYEVSVKSGVSQKKLIDSLRTRNGNMPITLTIKALEEAQSM